MNTKVKVGTKAYIFHDTSTGITVKKGEIKELTVAQYNSKRIRSAINGGHLVITNENIEKEIQKDVKVDNKKAIEKYGVKTKCYETWCRCSACKWRNA